MIKKTTKSDYRKERKETAVKQTILEKKSQERFNRLTNTEAKEQPKVIHPKSSTAIKKR